VRKKNATTNPEAAVSQDQINAACDMQRFSADSLKMVGITKTCLVTARTVKDTARL
jgi:hypothetical protein